MFQMIVDKTEILLYMYMYLSISITRALGLVRFPNARKHLIIWKPDETWNTSF